MDAEVTSAFRDLRDTLLDEMRTGFSGVYARQDKTNGRLLDAEKLIERHDERIRTIFRRIRGTNGGASHDDDGDDRRITQRDVIIVIGTAAIVVTILKLLPTLARMVTP